jgi:hypothetical protein
MSGKPMNNQSHQKIFGGTFGFPENFHKIESSPGFLDGNPILLFNARSGIKLVIDQLKPKNVWLPSYLCPDILTAIDPKISGMVFYPINSQLKVTSHAFIESIQPGDLFLFIDYFSFPFDEEILRRIKSRGCWLFRDCNQALFHDWHEDICDFYLYCPRKFLGVPDGGILITKDPIQIKPPNLMSPDPAVLYLFLSALVLRREFDLYGGDRTWFEYFQQGEAQLTPSYTSMSDISLTLLKMGFDYEAIQIQRRINYQVLNRKLSQFAVHSDLPENITPLGFPIRIDHRDQVRHALFKKNIYPPIHWTLTGFVPEEFSESHQLSQEMMTLPCDQRYSEEDMTYLADTVLELI